MVRLHRLVIGLVALAAFAGPAQAQAAFGPQARIQLTVPAGLQPDAVRDVAVDVDGSAFVLWAGIVQKYAPSGTLLKTWGGYGSAPGQFFPPPVKFESSTDDIEVDGLGHVYVNDYNGNRVVKFTTDGQFVANLGANGGDGTAGRGPGEFYHPWEVVTDAAGDLYVRDSSGFQPTLTSGQLQKLSPSGTVLARRSDPGLYILARGPGDRWYDYSGNQEVKSVTEADLVNERTIQPTSFPVLPGAAPGEKGYTQPSCCGIAFVGGRVWIGRGEVHAIEAYGPTGGFQMECPITGNNIQATAPGRDGRLYVLSDATLVRYGEGVQPCDTRAPRITHALISPPVLHTARRKRSGRLGFAVSEQATAQLTFTRLVRGRRVKGRCVRPRARNRTRRACVRRRVKEATVRGIPAYVDYNPGARLADLLGKKRLPHGRYKVRIQVVDHAGLRSRPAVLSLLVTR